VILLVPADVLHPRRPGGAARAVARVSGAGTAVYRGWMLAADRYEAFAAALADRGVVLRR